MPETQSRNIYVTSGHYLNRLSIFTMPVDGEAGGVASHNPAFYSFDLGNIHFLSLDSYGGAVKFLAKPFDRAFLLESVRVASARHGSRAATFTPPVAQRSVLSDHTSCQAAN